MARIIVIIFAVAAILYALFCLIGYIAYRILFINLPKMNRQKPNKLMGEDFPLLVKQVDDATEKAKALPYEKITVTTDDGLKLYGEFFVNPTPTKNTILCVHGYNSNGFMDFAPMVEPILSHGYNCFLLNHRHHGESEGKFTGFGILDSKDLVKWIEAINSRFPDGKIILYGVSMGAATVMLSSDLDLPENVAGIVEDCGFTTVYEEFSYQIRKTAHIPPAPILRMVNYYCKALLHFDIRAADSRECVKKTKIPFLFIHGSGDTFVPAYMCDECYNACGSEKKRIIFDGAYHAQSHFKYPAEYENDFFEFADKYTI